MMIRADLVKFKTEIKERKTNETKSWFFKNIRNTINL